jgi:hypothetical protein
LNVLNLGEVGLHAIEQFSVPARGPNLESRLSLLTGWWHNALEEPSDQKFRVLIKLAQFIGQDLRRSLKILRES